jgi:hypothetical protein
MERSDPSRQEANGEQIIEDINHLDKVGFGVGDVVCAVCDEPLNEGEPVVAYVVKPVVASSFTVGRVFCEEHEDEAGGLWSRSGRELVVGGRVGLVSDVSEQQSWPVLLDPEALLVSPVGSVEAYTPGEWVAMGERSRRVGGGGTGESGESDSSGGSDELVEPTDVARPAIERLAEERDDADGDGVDSTEEDVGDASADDVSGGDGA